jgi:DNA-3-methyladenine glycosylase II
MSLQTWRMAARKLLRDPHIGPVIKRCGLPTHIGDIRYFRTLVSSIISQQISVKVAASIKTRLIKRVKIVSPSRVAAVPIEELRSLGLSNQKASYVHDLASKFLDGTITPRRFHTMSDEEVIAELVHVRGIGRWTAEMFLMFSLCRDDVWPVDDYGIQKAAQKIFRMRSLPNKRQLQKIGERWRPYRSVAAMYLWRCLDQPSK